MTRSYRLLLAALLLAAPLPASANWFRTRPAVVAYYYPPVVCVPSYVPIYPIPVVAPVIPAIAATAEPPRIYATPVPAPASAPLGAPPAASPPPTQPAPAPPTSGATEAQSYYDAYAAAEPRGPRTSDRVSVGFWNSTPRPLLLRVQGQVQTLPAGRGVTIDLPREFVWQIEGRDAQTVRLPSSQAGADFVLRR